MEYLSCLLIIVLYLECISSFNLEIRVPIIKRGSRDSYFGYSVAQHQSIGENKAELNWLLVGAPLGNNLQPNTNRSGALFKCPISTRTDDCSQVVTDGKRAINSDELTPPLEDEIKDGQWLGVTVRSMGRGQKVMVCAHRYIKGGNEYQWGQGLCYTLSQLLDFDNTWDPCKGRPTNKAHEQFGYCQAGTSGVLVEDDDNTAVIGTPGPYTWRGTMFVMSISDNFIQRDKTYYYSPLKDVGSPSEVSPVDKYSYLGMSVGAGRFFDNNMVYVAGAPRASGTGQVVFFSKKKKGVNPMLVRLILSGDQFASSYGYEITTADIDGDNHTDLVVGAPFYFSRDKGGAVYIYTKLKQDCNISSEECNKPTVLTGLPESRFGFALTNLGDLNKDGYEDIAVGAPYEDSGTIYIYLGSKNGLLIEPSQVLRAKDLPLGSGTMRTLGYSLSGGMDLDHNGYPDLLVGAYEEDAVLLLRARPIIDILTTVRPMHNSLAKIDPSKRGCSRYPDSDFTCFTFSACCSIESLVRQQRPGATNLTLNYSIEAETFSGRKFSRVWFAPNEEIRPHIVKKSISLNPRIKMEHCEEETVYIKENTRDIQSPIKFRLTYTLVQREPRQARPGQPLPVIDNFPILNQQEAAKTFMATFQKDCGANDICESQMFLESSVLLPNSRKPHAWELTLGKDLEVELNITAHNLNESAYEAQLFVSHPASLSYTGHKTENKLLICRPVNNTMVSCNLGNPFKRGKPAIILIRFDPKGIQDSESSLIFVVFANSTSKEVDPQAPLQLHTEIIRQAELSITSVVQPDRVLYGGAVVGESATHTEDKVGSRVQHTYRVLNQGPWRVSNLQVHVEWPVQVENMKEQGKWLLYLLERPIVEAEGGGECIMEPGQVNPLGLSTETSTDVAPTVNDTLKAHSRRRRDIEMVIAEEIFEDKDGRRRKVVKMNCLLKSAKCIIFKCVVRNLKMNKEALIIIQARLWNSTLVEDYPKMDSVHISSRAKIHLPEIPLIHQNQSDDVVVAETVALPDRLDQHEPEPVPIWIIVVAVVAGLLLLVLLTLVLWKLGFFKRRRPDPTLSGNLEKHRDENGDYSS